jgi:UDP-3-O-[3-hydroxymyristoyl] glucosamine N-acyltransferase
MRLSAIATHVGGTLIGADKEISGVSTIEHASAHDITFLSNPKYREKAAQSTAGAILVSQALEVGLSQVIVDNPYLAFATTMELLYPAKRPRPGIDPLVYVDCFAQVAQSATVYPHVYIGRGAFVGEQVVIYPGCYIGENTRIGAGTTLYPHVTLYDDCEIGARCIIHAGVVIGADGFGFVWDGSKHRKIPQIGRVVIGDEVEIGSNCTIDRAALTTTVIGSDVKMDDMVHIGHNVTIGDHTIIVAQTGIAGSAHIGAHCVLAGQCGVAGHVTVGDGCTAASRAGITADLPPGKVVSGYPAMEHRLWLKCQKVFKELPDLAKRIRALERRLDGKD